MKHKIYNDIEKTFIAIGRTRMDFHSIIEEFIDNGIRWEQKINLNVKIQFEDIDDKFIKITYTDDSPGIPADHITHALGVGCQIKNDNLHCHGFGLSCVLAVLQETLKIENWVMKTNGKIVSGPMKDDVEINDEPNFTNGIEFSFTFPKINLRYLAHANAKRIHQYVFGLAARLGFDYRKYLQSGILNINIIYPGGSKTVQAFIPVVTTYRQYDVEMRDGRVHRVSFGKLDRLNKDDDVPDLFLGKSAVKGYFVYYKDKCLGLLKLDSIFDTSEYNTGKAFNYKEWYGEITLDQSTPGNVTNAIKDGMNEQHEETQMLMEQIKSSNHNGKNDLQEFSFHNPSEANIKNTIVNLFKETHGKMGWEIKKEFAFITHPDIPDPQKIDILIYHETLKQARWYELKKNELTSTDITQFAGYKTTIEALKGSSSANVNPILRRLHDQNYTFSYHVLCKGKRVIPSGQLLLDEVPSNNFFELEDYEALINK